MPTEAFSGKLAGAPLRLTFDDVLIEPARSNITSRSEVDLFHKGLDIPIISANMDTVTDVEMANAMANLGGLGVIHRFQDESRLLRKVRSISYDNNSVGAAIGLDTEPEFVERLYNAYCSMVVLDVAHGHMQQVLDKIEEITYNVDQKIRNHMALCAGNVVTRQGARDLFEAGASIVKVGVGPGSACTTRLKTGCGYPQLSAIAQCADVAKEYDGTIIADGGIRNSGDIVKALAAGADFVMIGGLLAGSKEAPGKTVYMDQRGLVVEEEGPFTVPYCKKFRGMASVGAALENGKSLYTPEGEEGWVKYKGPVEGIIEDLIGGVRSGMSYAGCGTIDQLHQRAQFVRVTNAGRQESDTRGFES